MLHDGRISERQLALEELRYDLAGCPDEAARAELRSVENRLANIEVNSNAGTIGVDERQAVDRAAVAGVGSFSQDAQDRRREVPLDDTTAELIRLDPQDVFQLTGDSAVPRSEPAAA